MICDGCAKSAASSSADRSIEYFRLLDWDVFAELIAMLSLS